MEPIRARVWGMGGIFICYRRDDTAPYARLLSESWLAAHFGRDAVYRDLDSTVRRRRARRSPSAGVRVDLRADELYVSGGWRNCTVDVDGVKVP